jgi:myo-inositol-1(or 4)-monophosphatase
VSAAASGQRDPVQLADVALRIAREAGALLAAGQAGVRVADTKTSPTDVVTAMDRASERLVVERLAQLRPGDGLLAEEGSFRPSDTGLEWVVDPLDGTVNYLYGVPFWSVSVAVREVGGGDRSLAGVVHAPVLGMTWVASAGGGASRDGIRLRGSSATALERALVGTGFDYTADRRGRQAQVMARVLPRIRDIRRLGSAAIDLCLAAEGILDAYFEQSLHPWDGAAGYLVAREAGLLVGGLDGAPPDERLTVAAPRALFGPLTALLSQEPRADRD